MSVLTLIRHGQASFFAANYDQLSALGERQSRALGEYWARRELSFDAVYTGPRVRQRHSAELAVTAAREAGHTCPEPVVLQDLDEYDLKGLTRLLDAPGSDATASRRALLVCARSERLTEGRPRGGQGSGPSFR